MSQNETVSLADILYGVGHGRVQSVGNMEVIPLVDEGDIQDTDLAPPDDVAMGTSDYGIVNLHNESSQPTIVPVGAGWVVKDAAQDHALGSGVLIAAGKRRRINTAKCIQSRQCGNITSGKREMLILPAQLRTQALALRAERGFDKLWSSIGQFNHSHGIGSEEALVPFLKHFKSQLDQFVAEFELVPNQIGAIILINGVLVGIELAPNVGYWCSVWTPLIRVCYGSWSIKMREQMQGPNRTILDVQQASLEGVRVALTESNRVSAERTQNRVDHIKSGEFMLGSVDEKMGSYRLIAVAAAGGSMGGQIVRSQAQTAPYVSVCINTK